MAIISFTFGVWVVAGGGNPLTPSASRWSGGRCSARSSSLLGWTVPDWLGATLDLVGQMAIPLMLLTLGVAIARLQPRALGRAFWLCLAKLAICVAVPLAVGLAFGLPRLRSACSCCRSPRRSRSPPTCSRRSTRRAADEVAGLVVVSTLVSIPAIPLLLAFFV